MQSEEVESIDAALTESTSVIVDSIQVVRGESVEAEEVPTIPLKSLQIISRLQPAISIHSVASTQAVSVPVPLVVQSSEHHYSVEEWVRVWWDGIRPAYLTLSLMPVLVGSVVAWVQSVSAARPFGLFHFGPFIITLVAVVILQVGAHLVNDYYDYIHGIDTSNAFGPGGLIQQDLIEPTRILTLGLSLLTIGAILGMSVAFIGGPLVFLLGLIGLLGAFFYSGTTQSLASQELGEMISFLVFGPLITLGAYIVQAEGQHIHLIVLLYSLPLGLFAAAVIHVNNIRDLEGDAYGGKRTIALLLGLRWSRILFLMLVLAVYVPITIIALPYGGLHLLLLTLWTLPLLAIVISGIMRTDATAGFDLVMRQTLRLETYFALLLILALIASVVLPGLSHFLTL